jgi:small redox-active disulfide protein 2
VKYLNEFKITNKMSLEIKVLGTGCAKCKTLESVTREVVALNNIDANITKVDDIIAIMKYSVMSTPALVINEKVALSGRIPSKDELKTIIEKYTNA